MTLPTGYVAVDMGRTRGFAWSGADEWARQALEEHGSLDAWAAATAGARTMSGRGTVRVVPAPASGPDRRPSWVVRRYLRGGAMAPVLRDRYLRVGRARPLRELDAVVAARARGVPTPAVVAGAVYPVGPVHYRADLVTELVPDATELAAILFEDAAPGQSALNRLDALRAGGKLVALAGAAGVRHPDLNARNIVLNTAEDGAPAAWMVDLDRCRVRSTPLPGADTPAMLARLERSLRKLGGTLGPVLSDPDWAALREGAAT